MHDAGIWRSAELEQFEQQEAQARQKLESLNPQVLRAQHQEKVAREIARGNVRWEQAPALDKVAELEHIEQKKMAQERAARAKDQAIGKVLADFKTNAIQRETKSLGFGDAGQRWNALPEPIRQSIEGYNALGKEARQLALEKIGASLKGNPKALERLEQGLAQGKSNDRDRGFER